MARIVSRWACGSGYDAGDAEFRGDGLSSGDSVHGAGEAVAALSSGEAVGRVDLRVEVLDDHVAGVEHVVHETEVNAYVTGTRGQVALAERVYDGHVVTADV